MKIEDYEKLQPVTTIEADGRRLRFFTPNSHTLWRARTFFTKEPDTLEWIRGFGEGEVLLDVGANVGRPADRGVSRDRRTASWSPSAS